MTLRPKNVIVTGVSSFLGVHLARAFSLHGSAVTAIISKPLDHYSSIRAERLVSIQDRVSLRTADLTRPDVVAALVHDVAPDLFVHHAGNATAYSSPDYDLAASVATNVTPLEAIYLALKGGKCGVIITGSSAEYSTSDSANTEADACLPDSPYGLSKLMETLRARQLSERFGVPTRVARLYIPFGRLDHPDKLVSQVVSQLSQGKPVALSPCRQARDFIGVGDVCEAWVRLAGDLPRTMFDIFNISSGQATVLRDFLLVLADRIGASASLLEFGRHSMRPGEPMASYGSNEKAKQLLSWAPIPLMTAVERDLLAPAGT